MDEYPNSSEVFDQQWQPEVPKERKEAEEKEQSKIITSMPVIQDVLDWFETNIQMYSDVDALGIDEKTPDSEAKFSALFAKKMKLGFETKQSDFRLKFGKYLEKLEEDKL